MEINIETLKQEKMAQMAQLKNQREILEHDLALTREAISATAGQLNMLESLQKEQEEAKAVSNKKEK